MERFLIRLNDVILRGKIGVFDFEREEGNDFRFNIELEIDASTFIEEDLNTSLSYADVYEEIVEVLSKEWHLLETVAITLARHFRMRWPRIIRGRIRIDKLRPPITGINGNCGIEYVF